MHGELELLWWGRGGEKAQGMSKLLDGRRRDRDRRVVVLMLVREVVEPQ